MKRAHCAVPWGWEMTTAISSSDSSERAIRQWLIARSCSPTMLTPSASKARVSRVERTAPSIEFSNGTRARSASPEATAATAA